MTTNVGNLVCGNSVARSLAATLLLALASWSSPASADDPTWTQFQVSSNSEIPAGITVGPDGALWFVRGGGANVSIGRITTDGTVSSFPVSTAPGVSLVTNEEPNGKIVAGPDGALWFVDTPHSAIGRITTSGSVSTFPISCPDAFFPSQTNCIPTGITVGVDGALWFTMRGCSRCLPGPSPSAIGRITTSGTVSLLGGPSATATDIITGSDGALYYVGTSAADGQRVIGRMTTGGSASQVNVCAPGNLFCATLEGITAGPDGNVWFTNSTGKSVSRMTPGGSITTFSTPGPFAPSPFKIGVGPDGALWFTTTEGGQIGQITTTGQITMYLTRTAGGIQFIIGVTHLTTGPDGNLWVTESNSGASPNHFVARVGLPPSPSPLLGAVLPSGRSVQVGTAATAFATMINTGASAAHGCGLASPTQLPTIFTYQTTDPATNAPTGTANTPVTIPPGGAQSYVFAVTPNATLSPTDVRLGFACADAAAAPSVSGLNTLLLSASNAPVADIVALGATSTNDGILHITGTSGNGAFAVATVNVGATASITASADTGTVVLPLAVGLCQTNPGTGACTSAIGPSVTTTIDGNATPTFAIFVTASGAIANSPAVNRIFVRFKDGGGVTRGSTSVAVLTE